MKFSIDPKVFEKFPKLIIALPIIMGFDNTKNAAKALQFLRKTEEDLQTNLTLEQFWQDPRVTSYLNCFKAFGVDPEKFRPAHVALAKRVLEGGQLPDINPMVNLYNGMSIKYLTPFGGEDLNSLYGNFVLKFANGGEQWIPIGGDKSKPAIPGELVWGDDYDLSTRALNWRQCDRTKMTVTTTNGYFVMDGFADVNLENIKKAADDFIKTATNFFGGEAKIYWLDIDTPAVEIPFESKKPGSLQDKPNLVEQPKQQSANKLHKKNEFFYQKGTLAYDLAVNILTAVKAAFPEVKIKLEDISLEHPTAEEFGDYSTNIALKLKLGNPKEVAEKIAHQLQETTSLEATVAGPGFINFKLSTQDLVNQVQQALSEGERYGQGSTLSSKKIMVEFAHPNTHKQFHIGHLRNITTGECFCRLFTYSGAEVSRTNYQGDVGMHVAKALYGVMQLKEKYSEAKNKDTRGRVAFLGEAYVLGSKEFEENEKAKPEIVALNKKIYLKDPEILDIYKETRQWSLDYFQLIYDRVYTKFDRLYFEGEVAERGKELVLANVGKVFEESEGAIIFRGEKFGLHNRVFVNSEGNPTYEGKDMGLGELQFKEYNPDLLIHNLGPEQLSYTSVMFEALAQIFPETRGREMHLPYGWVKLKAGKMSSRTGNVVLGEWLLDEIKKKLSEKYPDKLTDPEPIAIAAAKYSLLKVGREQEIAFDIDDSVSLDGDSGPYLQYTYARAKSVLRKAGDYKKAILDPARMTTEELSIVRYLYRFPEVVEAAARSYSPNLLCSYLFELAKRFNNFYNNCPILENNFRLALTQATAIVLKNGLHLLGIEALEKM